ncbi:hypothetical protein BAE44_0005767 [Dichanthelium oligosanthes]|uniref:Uncharacterized protein n=1 Tax=Dichanthelium oligosanthes TaxID=888268 RepID=A0A1E5W763_9POAL|nr:hypothetical protein BAE44_0005767 [Dichanthelium oligosanthes]
MTVDAALLAAVVAFLLPLRLISFAIRLASKGHSTSARHLRRSCAALAIAAALLSVIFALPRDRAGDCAVPVATVVDGDELRSEVEQLKLQLARLESLLDDNSKALDKKGDTLEKALDKKGDPLEEEDGRVMRAMGLDIQSLINEQENIKIQESLCSSYFGDNIKAMEDEVRLIKDESRKMTSDIHSVWSLAKDTTEKVEALHSDIKKVYFSRLLFLFIMPMPWLPCDHALLLLIYIGLLLSRTALHTNLPSWSSYVHTMQGDKLGKMNSNINRLWSFVKDTEKKDEGLCSDIKKVFLFKFSFVRLIADAWGKTNFNINRMWSFAKDTEKKVEGLYSDIKKVCFFGISICSILNVSQTI